MNLPRQDRNGVRTPIDVQRRMKNKQVEENTKQIQKIDLERVVDATLSKTSTNAIQNKAVTKALEDKADKVEGKGFSTKDFTEEYEKKLNDIEEKAQVNIIEKINIDNIPIVVSEKTVNINIFKRIDIQDNKRYSFIFKWFTDRMEQN